MRGNGWYQELLASHCKRGGVMVVGITFFTELSASLMNLRYKRASIVHPERGERREERERGEAGRLVR